MFDIHKEEDRRNIVIENVGINEYFLPIVFQSNFDYATLAKFKVGMSLSSNIKGAHLSRIISILDENFANKKIKITDLNMILRILKSKIESDNVNLNMNFDIITSDLTPASSIDTYIRSNINLFSKINENEISKSISIETTGAMLCPSSKKNSNYGAHSQRSILKVTMYENIDDLIIDEVINIMRKQFSCEVYGVVKREDEKFMTERAYDRPRFSEDVVRDTLIAIRNYCQYGLLEAELENYESIHQHNVYCRGILK